MEGKEQIHVQRMHFLEQRAADLHGGETKAKTLPGTHLLQQVSSHMRTLLDFLLSRVHSGIDKCVNRLLRVE